MACNVERIIDQNASRFTDAADEPVTRLLAPIRGYQDVPLVSLDVAVEPIASFFCDIEDNIYVAQENCKTPVDDLSSNESAAIHLYTMQFDGGPSLYQLLNRTLRSENREDLKPWFSYLKLFLTALYKLPSHSGTVWRGVREEQMSASYTNGSKFTWWGISSCSLDIGVIKNFLGNQGKRTIFSIECINGKSIAAHSHFKNTEQEIILMPGSYFVVVGQLDPSNELRIIHLKELVPPISFVKPPFSSSLSTPQTTSFQTLAKRVIASNTDSLSEPSSPMTRRNEIPRVTTPTLNANSQRKDDNFSSTDKLADKLAAFSRKLVAQANARDLEVADECDNIGGIFHSEKKYPEALENHQKALSIRERCLPDDHPDLAESHLRIGTILAKAKGRQSKDALDHLHQASAIHQRAGRNEAALRVEQHIYKLSKNPMA